MNVIKELRQRKVSGWTGTVLTKNGGRFWGRVKRFDAQTLVLESWTGSGAGGMKQDLVFLNDIVGFEDGKE